MGRLLIVTSILLLAACTSAPIADLYDRPATRFDGETLTMQEIESAILQGMANRGWRAKEKEPGRILAELHHRQHEARVEIDYDTRSYRITYHSSHNLERDGDSIHRNYNRWVRYLDASIQQQLSSR